MRSKKIYSAAEFDEGIRLALDKEQQESDAKWEEAVQQAFKDGLNRASEHIAADAAAMPEPEIFSLEMTLHEVTLARARISAREKARKVFGSTFMLEIIVTDIVQDTTHASFYIKVVATKKPRKPISLVEYNA